MAQPAHIELRTGPDRAFQFAGSAVWMLAAVVVMTHVQLLAWPFTIAAALLLVMLQPGSNDTLEEQAGRLLLYRNGAALFTDRAATWGIQSWACRWFAIVRIDQPQGSIRVMVCASLNSFDEYRRLLVWTRFTPFDRTAC